MQRAVISSLITVVIIIILIISFSSSSSSSSVVAQNNNDVITWPDDAVNPTLVYEGLTLRRFIITYFPVNFVGDLTIKNCNIAAVILQFDNSLDPDRDTAALVPGYDLNALVFKDDQRLLIVDSTLSLRGRMDDRQENWWKRVWLNCSLKRCGIEVRGSTFALQSDEQLIRPSVRGGGAADYGVFVLDHLRWGWGNRVVGDKTLPPESSRAFIRIINNSFSSNNFPRQLIEDRTIQSMLQPRNGTSSFQFPGATELGVIRIESSVWTSSPSEGFEELTICENSYYTDIGALRFLSAPWKTGFYNVKLINFSANEFYGRGQRAADDLEMFRFFANNENIGIDGLDQYIIEDNHFDFEEPGAAKFVEPVVGSDVLLHGLNFCFICIQFHVLSNITTISISRNNFSYIALDDETTRSLVQIHPNSFRENAMILFSPSYSETQDRDSRNISNFLVLDNHAVIKRVSNGLLVQTRWRKSFDYGKVVFARNSIIAQDFGDVFSMEIDTLNVVGLQSLLIENNSAIAGPLPPPAVPIFHFAVIPGGSRRGSFFFMFRIFGIAAQDGRSERFGWEKIRKIEFTRNFMHAVGNGHDGNRAFSCDPRIRDAELVVMSRNNLTSIIREGFLNDGVDRSASSKSILLLMSGLVEGVKEFLVEDNYINIDAGVSVVSLAIYVGNSFTFDPNALMVHRIVVRRNNIQILKSNSSIWEQIVGAAQFIAASSARGYGTIHFSENIINITNLASGGLSGTQAVQISTVTSNSVVESFTFENNQCRVVGNGNLLSAIVYVSANLSSQSTIFQPFQGPRLFLRFDPVETGSLGEVVIRSNDFVISNTDIHGIASFVVSGKMLLDNVAIENNTIDLAVIKSDERSKKETRNSQSLQNSFLVAFTPITATGFGEVPSDEIDMNATIILGSKAEEIEVMLQNNLTIRNNLPPQSSSSNYNNNNRLLDCGETLIMNTISLNVQGEIRIENMQCKSQNLALPNEGLISKNAGTRNGGAFFFSTGQSKSTISRIVIVNSSMDITSYCTLDKSNKVEAAKTPQIVATDGPLIFSQTAAKGETTVGEINFDKVSFSMKCASSNNNNNNNNVVRLLQLPSTVKQMIISRSNFTISNIDLSTATTSSEFSFMHTSPAFSSSSASNTINVTDSRVLLMDSANREVENLGKAVSSSSSSPSSPSNNILMYLRCVYWNNFPLFLSSTPIKASTGDDRASFEVDFCPGYELSSTMTHSDVDSETHEITHSKFTATASSSISQMEPELDPTFSTSAATLTGFYSTLVAVEPTSLLLTVQGISLLSLAECHVKSSSKRSVRIAKENATRAELMKDLDFPEILIPSFRIGGQLGGSHRAAIVTYLILFLVAALVTFFIGTINKSKWKEFCNKKRTKNNKFKFDYSLSFLKYASIDKVYLKALVVAVAFVFPTCGVLVAEQPSGGGDVFLGIFPVSVLVLSCFVIGRMLFSYVSSVKQKQRKKTDRDDDQDQENEEDVNENSTPLHYMDESGLYFSKTQSSGGAKNKIMWFLQTRVGRYLMLGGEAWENPYFDFDANASQPGPGERTQLFELFQKYRGPLKLKEEKPKKKTSERSSRSSRTERRRVSEFDEEFARDGRRSQSGRRNNNNNKFHREDSYEEELLDFSPKSSSSRRSRGNNHNNSNTDRQHHHRSSSSRHRNDNHNNKNSRSSSRRGDSSSINGKRDGSSRTRKFDQDDVLKSQLLAEFHQQTPTSISSSKSSHHHHHREKPQFIFDFSLRRRLCSSWFFIGLVITAVVSVLAGTGRANSDNCFGAFIGTFVLTFLNLILFSWLRPFIVPWMNLSSIVLSICNVVGGLAFLYVFVSVRPESENDDTVGRRMMEFRGWIWFGQAMCAFPAAILGPVILGLKGARVGLLTTSKSKVVTMSSIRFRLIAELESVEKSLSLGDLASTLGKRRAGTNNGSSSSDNNINNNDKKNNSKNTRRNSSHETKNSQQSWFFGLFS